MTTSAAGRGTYSVGRVQTPTLAMVCQRFWENKRFQPEPVHQLHFTTPSVSVDEVVKFASVEKWKDKEEAAALYNKVKAQMTATVTKVEKKEKVENPPLLYDLTTLQKEANTENVEPLHPGGRVCRSTHAVRPSGKPFPVCGED